MVALGTRILDSEGSVHAVRTAGGWASALEGEIFSSADVEAFDAIARGESDAWPPSELNGGQTWSGMRAAAEPESARVLREVRKDRFASLERLLNEALETVNVTRGRAAADQQGVGVVRGLLERSLASLKIVSDDVLSPTRGA